MRALIPFKPSNVKSRLSPVLNPEERLELALCMLQDVVDAIRDSAVEEYSLLATEPIEGHPCIISPHGLNRALNEAFKEVSTPLVVVMSDLPLLKPHHIDEITSEDGVTIAPGRGGGTNVLYMRKPQRFEAHYYGASFLTHLDLARDKGIPARIYDSFYTSTDIDVPDDLVEVLLHGEGRTPRLLREWGFEIKTNEGRVKIQRK